MITVVTWLWKSTGWRSYSQKHVNALDRQLQEHLNIPYKLVCVTDSSKGINCETYPLWDEPKVEVKRGQPNCYCRLKLFSHEAKDMFGDWVVSMDLDTLIRHDISDLFQTDADFKIMKGSVTPYNGSLWLLKTGSRPQVWEEFDPVRSPQKARENQMPDGKRFVGSDQAWISSRLSNSEETWDKSDGIYNFINDVGVNECPPSVRVVQFPGGIKPWSGQLATKNRQLFDEYKRFLE